MIFTILILSFVVALLQIDGITKFKKSGKFYWNTFLKRFKWEDYNWRPMIVSLISFAILILSIVQTWKDEREKGRTEEKIIATHNLSVANKELSENISKLTSQNNNLASQTLKLSLVAKDINKQVLDITTESLNFMNSKNSFPFLWFKLIADSQIVYQIDNRGNYPLNNVAFIVHDVDVVNNKDPALLFNAMNREQIINAGTIGRGQGFSGTLELSIHGTERNFKVAYTTSNKSFSQWIKVRRKNEAVFIASKVEEFLPNGNMQIMFQKIDSGFLNKEEKSVPWTNYWFFNNQK